MKKVFAFLMLAGMFTACTVKTTESTKSDTTVVVEDTTVAVEDTTAVDTLAIDSVAL